MRLGTEFSLGTYNSLFIVFNTSFIALIVYYTLMYSFESIIESESCSYVYSAILVFYIIQLFL